jgi:hypothetical protein
MMHSSTIMLFALAYDQLLDKVEGRGFLVEDYVQ